MLGKVAAEPVAPLARVDSLVPLHMHYVSMRNPCEVRGTHGPRLDPQVPTTDIKASIVI